MTAIILRQYLDRSRDALFEPFPDDQWELTDLLRAADSRIGKVKLLALAKTLDEEHAALAILKRRLQIV